MRYKPPIVGALILGFIIWAGAPISAQTRELYDRVGMLDAMNSDLKSVVIYDVLYNLRRDIKVYLFNPEVDNTSPKKREEVSLESLTPGMILGYTVTYTGNIQPGQIKEIWILPSESVATMNSEANEKGR